MTHINLMKLGVKIVENRKFDEDIRNISNDVGKYAKENKDGNPYKKAYELVEEYVEQDRDKLMQLKAECSLNSYEAILAAGIKICLGIITILTFIWGIISKLNGESVWIVIVSIVYILAVPFIVWLIAQVHHRYKYVGIGEKYVKLVVENMIQEYEDI